MPAAISAFARKRQVACNAILEATSAIIAEKGVDAFTISEVGRRAKINRALIYHYFQDRDNLVAQTIDHILSRYRAIRPEAGAQAVDSGVRMHLEHPEVARFFFQMLLNGRPLLGMDKKLHESIDAMEAFTREHAPDADVDPTFMVVNAMLNQLSWAFSRKEIARLLGISMKEADKRFIAQDRRAAGLRLREMTGARK